MERMKKRTDFYDAIDKIQRQDKYIEYIEEENKKLKEELEKWKDTVKTQNEYNKFRIEENEKLREELSAYNRENFDEDKKAQNIFIDKSGKVIKGGKFTTLC